MKKELNLDEIKRLYIEENKTLREIAQLMNCWYGTIQHQLSNFIIYFPKESRLDFERLIFPYMIPSMYYKLKFLDILKAESVG